MLIENPQFNVYSTPSYLPLTIRLRFHQDSAIVCPQWVSLGSKRGVYAPYLLLVNVDRSHYNGPILVQVQSQNIYCYNELVEPMISIVTEQCNRNIFNKLFGMLHA